MEKLRNKECVFAWNNKYIFSTFIKKVCSKNLVDPHHFKIRTPKIPCNQHPRRRCGTFSCSTIQNGQKFAAAVTIPLWKRKSLVLDLPSAANYKGVSTFRGSK
jgi:hypothetical protein